MPKSRVRRKKVYTPPSQSSTRSRSKNTETSPPWVPVLALVLALAGMVWLVIYYMTGQQYPIASLGPWNIVAGFSGIVASLITFTQWK